MERRFDMTNFEQSLKDQADQLTMIPSKKVWNGIYNNLHPGSSWPSLAMAFFFLFTFFGIGHLNNNNYNTTDHSDFTNQAELNNKPEKRIEISPALRSATSEKQIAFSADERKQAPVKYLRDNYNQSNPISDKNVDNKKTGSITKNTAKVVSLSTGKLVEENSINNQPGNGAGNENLEVESKLKGAELLEKTENNIIKTAFAPSEIALSTFKENTTRRLFANLEIEPVNYSEYYVELLTLINAPLPLAATEPSKEIVSVKDDINSFEKVVINTKKRNEKTQWAFYVAPSVSTPSFINKDIQTPNSNASTLVIRRNQQPYGMIYSFRFGFEAGVEMSSTIWKKLQLTSGITFSNLGYHVISNQVHPTFAKLTLQEENSGIPYSQTYITHYGNGQSQNQVSLSNYNLRISIPIGLQQALFENNKIKINLATAIAPGYLVKSQAFLISSDGRYYVEDPSLLRKMNVNGKIGTFITFKSDKIKWQLGPTFSYQLLSSYEKKYPVKEHLLDYGIRIGISK